VQRLFFALWPDHGLGNRLNRLAGELPERGGRQHHPSDLHMTLVFLGPVAPERLPCIEQVGDQIRLDPFTLYLDQVDYWQRPRILCLGASDPPAPLISLVQSLQSGLVGCGFEPEKRLYKPHVTLVRKAKRQHAFGLDSPIEWPVNEFVLAGSCSGENPLRYQIIKHWSLQNR